MVIDLNSTTENKTAYFTATMASVGNSVNVTHGLTQSKIIGVQALVYNSSGYLITPGYSGSGSDATNYFGIIVGSSTIDLITGSSATSIAGQTAQILITYTE